jgi:hypothetical protein
MEISPAGKLSASSEKLQDGRHRVGKGAELIVF